LACKGCKGDCPVNVDVATYKAEFFAHYWKGRIRPRTAYAMGFISQWARLASIAPGLVNFVTQTPGLAAIAKRIAGIAADRPIPPFAARTFRAQFARRAELVRRDPPAGDGKRVLVWPDTFTNHFHPEVALSAVDVLESAGLAPAIPRGSLCCGRPLYDFGMV